MMNDINDINDTTSYSSTSDLRVKVAELISKTKLTMQQKMYIINLFISNGYEDIFNYEKSGLIINIDRIKNADLKVINILNDYIISL